MTPPLEDDLPKKNIKIRNAEWKSRRSKRLVWCSWMMKGRKNVYESLWGETCAADGTGADEIHAVQLVRPDVILGGLLKIVRLRRPVIGWNRKKKKKTKIEKKEGRKKEKTKRGGANALSQFSSSNWCRKFFAPGFVRSVFFRPFSVDCCRRYRNRADVVKKEKIIRSTEKEEARKIGKGKQESWENISPPLVACCCWNKSPSTLLCRRGGIAALAGRWFPSETSQAIERQEESLFRRRPIRCVGTHRHRKHRGMRLVKSVYRKRQRERIFIVLPAIAAVGITEVWRLCWMRSRFDSSWPQSKIEREKKPCLVTWKSSIFSSSYAIIYRNIAPSRLSRCTAKEGGRKRIWKDKRASYGSTRLIDVFF